MCCGQGCPRAVHSRRPPTIDAAGILDLALSARIDREQRATLAMLRTGANGNSIHYRQRLSSYQRMDPRGFTPNQKKQIGAAYSRVTAQNHASGLRSVILDDEHGNLVCVYCGMQPGRQIDHFLPRSIYPEFGLEPWNLVPSCADCNKDKGEVLPEADGARFLHAFLDPDLSEPYLFSTVTRRRGSIVVLFYVQTPAAMPGPQAKGIRNQFLRLDLGRRFAQAAEETCAEVVGYAEDLDDAARAVYLTSILRTTSARGANHWRHALHRGIRDYFDGVT